MDSNQTRFHLLFGNDWPKWRQSLSDPSVIDWDEARQEVTLAKRAFRFTAGKGDLVFTPEHRRGAARDRFGNWYWIADSTNELLVNSSGDNVTAHFWSNRDGVRSDEKERGDFGPVEKPAPCPPLQLRGLAVTEDHYLVVGVLEPAGLLIFDLHSGGPPQQFLWPRSIPFAPFDMAARPGGGVWILDRDNRRFWGMGRFFEIIPLNFSSLPQSAAPEPDDFVSEAGDAPAHQQCKWPTAITADSAIPLACHDPIAIEALPDRSVLVLDSNIPQEFSCVWRYRGPQLLSAVSLESMAPLFENDPSFLFNAHDFALVLKTDGAEAKKISGDLFVVGEDGNQTFRFELEAEDDASWQLKPSDDYFPMRLFEGKALVAAGDAVFYDLGSRWVPLIKQPRRRYATEAVVELPIFDSDEPDCVWHRLMLDGCLPPETNVEVWSRAANTKDDLELATWELEPKLVRRDNGTELPYFPNPSSAHGGTWELLFQRAEGRFLQLRLRLGGNGQSSPRLRALRVWYPRFSYLKRYLPAVYQDDKTSASFLERFLANPEGIFTCIEDKIAAMQILFDARTAPVETLDWLGSWLGILFDPAWDDRRKRLFIRHAMEFFQYRGTPRGLKMALRLAFEENPGPSLFTEQGANSACAQRFRIVEKFTKRRTPPALLGERGVSGQLTIDRDKPWTPAMGSDELHRRYREFLDADSSAIQFLMEPPAKDVAHWREFLRDRYNTLEKLQAVYGTGVTFDNAVIPSSAASSPVRADYDAFSRESAARWESFAMQALGFVPTTATDDRERWQSFLEGIYTDIDPLNHAHRSNWKTFSEITLPSGSDLIDAVSADWAAFIEEHGLMGAEQLERWQNFLRRRYRWIKNLRDAYKATWKSFDEVPLPATLPTEEQPLWDWLEFEGVAMSMHDTAHRFSVLLPADRRYLSDREELRRQLGWAERIVQLEKPAHTVFDVKFYWAFFRVGDARLGEDTQLGQGSRAPELLPPMILDHGYLSEAYLAPSHPRNVADRRILGRDALLGIESKEE